MRSAAHIKGHPIHPMLVAFPIGFLAGAFIFDLLGVLMNRASLWTAGGYMAAAGIITAGLAAAPGIADYLRTVPPNSSAKKRATMHMMVNGTSVGLYLVAWLIRGDASFPPSTGVILMEGLGLGLLSIGGWLGGELVSKNHISVHNAYAGSARWKEVTLELMTGRPGEVPGANELEVNQMMLVRVGENRRLVVGRTKTGFVAFDDHCTHKGGSLCGGVLINGTVQCPWHGSQFDVATGQVVCGPAERNIHTYRVEETGGKVMLSLDVRAERRHLTLGPPEQVERRKAS